MRQKVAEFCPKLGASYFPKKTFFGKVDQNCFGLSIVSHHDMSFQNNSHGEHENKVAPVLPKLALVQKVNFFGKLTNMTNV